LAAFQPPSTKIVSPWMKSEAELQRKIVRLVRETVETLPAETRAVVVGSEVPGVFAAGGDIPWMARAPIEEQLVFVRECQDAYSSFERLHCPAIAAIDGQGVARDLLLTGRRISGAEAGALGIASRVVADGTATEVARGIGRQLADGATEAIEATKRLAVRAPDYTLEQGLAAERAEWAGHAPLSQVARRPRRLRREAPDFRGVG
jgi:enoyl-CoA hydratase/carnithine racemase